MICSGLPAHGKTECQAEIVVHVFLFSNDLSTSGYMRLVYGRGNDELVPPGNNQQIVMVCISATSNLFS